MPGARDGEAGQHAVEVERLRPGAAVVVREQVHQARLSVDVAAQRGEHVAARQHQDHRGGDGDRRDQELLISLVVQDRHARGGDRAVRRRLDAAAHGHGVRRRSRRLVRQRRAGRGTRPTQARDGEPRDADAGDQAHGAEPGQLVGRLPVDQASAERAWEEAERSVHDQRHGDADAPEVAPEVLQLRQLVLVDGAIEHQPDQHGGRRNEREDVVVELGQRDGEHAEPADEPQREERCPRRRAGRRGRWRGAATTGVPRPPSPVHGNRP